MGGSYGGYATLVGLTFTPEMFACGVDDRRPVEPDHAAEDDSAVLGAGDASVQGPRRRSARPTRARNCSSERSPLTHVDKIKRPLLIGQGANDPRVKQAEADQIVKAMQEKKIPVTYVLFPDEGHGFAPAGEPAGVQRRGRGVPGQAPRRPLRADRRRLRGLDDHGARRRRRRAGVGQGAQSHKTPAADAKAAKSIAAK